MSGWSRVLKLCVLTVYRLEGGHYGPAALLELKGQTRITVVPDVTIDWDEVLASTA